MNLNFYPDSNFYERLTKRGNEHHWEEFINECEKHKIDIPSGCSPFFTPFLVLERIGLGGILQPLQKGMAYKALVKGVQSYIIGMPDPKGLNEKDREKLKQEVADMLDGMGEIFSSLLHQLPDLQIGAFLEKFDIEIGVYATSAAAGDLVEATLKRFREYFNQDPSGSLNVVKGDLIWNLIATFPFIEPDTVLPNEAAGMFDRAELWFNALFASFHKIFATGRRIGFFRLAENRYHTYSKIVAKDLSNQYFAQASTWLKQYKPLRRRDDLCDGEMVDFAILGSDGQKVFCFTSDDSTDVGNRLSLLKGTLDEAAKQVKGWMINPYLGRVYCVSKRGLPLEIMHSFLLDQ